MVKFAEAEKRRGEGGDRRYAPLAMLERPKTSRAMWESLKEHIMKERRRKKEELEADAEEKRIQKEIENRKKQHVMSLEETREKISQKETELSELKSQKHQLFQELKVVLNEDATRKRQQQQQNYIKESEIIAASIHSYPAHGAIPIGSHPQMLFQSGLMAGRSGVHTLMKAGAGVPLPGQPASLNAPVQQMLAEQNRLVHSGMKKTQLYEAHHKRPRSPVTPPPTAYQMALPYGMKSLPVSAHAVISHPVAVSTTSGIGPYYRGGSSSAGSGHGSSGSYQSSGSGGATRGSPSPYQLGNPQQSQPPPQHRQDEKHLGPVYMAPHSTRPTSGHVSLHSVDHKGKSSSSGFPPGSEPPQDKYFSAAGGVPRTHLTLHSGVLPVQQPQPGGGKSGSITSGFPVRGGPPPSTLSSAPPVSSTATHTYSGQVAYTRSYY